jgi:hypothetical protein
LVWCSSSRSRRNDIKLKQSAVKQGLLVLLVLASWLGVGVQLWVSVQRSLTSGTGVVRGLLHALVYFTVLTNLLVAMGSAATLARAARADRGNGVLAALAVYIFVVGLIYSLLLRHTWQPTGAQYLADVLLHDVVPVLYVTWWLTCAPKSGLRYPQAFSWLVWPLGYFLVSVVAGEFTGRYLYPFADVSALGLPVVLRNAGALLTLFLVLGALAITFARRATRSSGKHRDA